MMTPSLKCYKRKCKAYSLTQFLALDVVWYGCCRCVLCNGDFHKYLDEGGSRSRRDNVSFTAGMD